MLKRLFPETTASPLALVILLLFVVFFVSLVLWVYRRGGKPEYEALSKLPLDEDAKHGY